MIFTRGRSKTGSDSWLFGKRAHVLSRARDTLVLGQSLIFPQEKALRNTGISYLPHAPWILYGDFLKLFVLPKCPNLRMGQFLKF